MSIEDCFGPRNDVMVRYLTFAISCMPIEDYFVPRNDVVVRL